MVKRTGKLLKNCYQKRPEKRLNRTLKLSKPLSFTLFGLNLFKPKKVFGLKDETLENLNGKR